jgi:hypothetical protein
VIFGRKKSAQDTDDDIDTEIVDELDDDEVDADEDYDDAEDDEDYDDDDDDEVWEEELDEWALLDRSQDWREDGPFDYDEVDLSDDDIDRENLGALIVTPEVGQRLKLVASGDPEEITSLVVENGPASGMQVSVLAAPTTANFLAEVRQELIEASEKGKSIELVEGPFGTEVRRIVAMEDGKGREVYAPVRDWLIAGPRWVLKVTLTGKAALDHHQTGAAADLEEFVRNIIVRRGDVAMVPGSVVPLTPVTD